VHFEDDMGKSGSNFKIQFANLAVCWQQRVGCEKCDW